MLLIERTFKMSIRTVAQIALAAALVANATHADDPVLRPYRAEYKVGNQTINAGRLINRLEKDGDRWRYQSDTNPSALVSLHGAATATATSILELRDGKLRQLEFTYRDKDRKKKAHSDGDFDWENNQITVTYGDKSATLDLEDDTFDAASAVLALGLALTEGLEEITLNLVNKTRIRAITFVSEGEEEIEIALGKFTGIKIREVRDPGKRFTTSWYVPELGYLPARMEQYNKDKLVVRMELVKLEPRQ